MTELSGALLFVYSTQCPYLMIDDNNIDDRIYLVTNQCPVRTLPDSSCAHKVLLFLVLVSCISLN